MNTTGKTPFVIVAALGITGLFIFFYILYIGSGIILPVIYAAIMAVLLNPLVNRLCRHRINRVLAIGIAVILLLLLFFGLMYFVIDQSLRFADSLPVLQQKLNMLLQQFTQWASRTFRVSGDKVDKYIVDTENRQLNASAAILGQTLITATAVLKLFFLIPVYVFMFLFYKPLLLDFFSRVFRRESHETVGEVLYETKTLIQSYLVGLLLEAAIVAALNGIGLLLLGIDYALLLAIIGALLNIIPYIGGIVAVVLPVLIAYTTKSPVYVLWVLALYMAVQFIDNHYIMPRIVASKVRINALVSIVVVFIGGAIWGVAGMFLAVPLTAILKVIFDRITPLNPWGFLLGDTMPPIGKIIFKSPPESKKKP
ncbi:AI-2E family transporter [Niastella vici]|uniref:AI-2E family transporter n=1 Tax=Niastella vici TaxID=1703345 RepID=A0A1V9G721_9BACT|nr:AI-2E family transporter [Niastella vici]OQP66278.1 AI-2E family transporter [Niastella vici]